MECNAPCQLDFQSGLGRHAQLPMLQQWLGKNDFAHLLLPASLPIVRECIDPRQLLLLDVGYIKDTVDPPYQGEKDGASHDPSSG